VVDNLQRSSYSMTDSQMLRAILSVSNQLEQTPSWKH